MLILRHRYLNLSLVTWLLSFYLCAVVFPHCVRTPPFAPGLDMAECDGREINHVAHVAPRELD